MIEDRIKKLEESVAYWRKAHLQLQEQVLSLTATIKTLVKKLSG